MSLELGGAHLVLRADSSQLQANLRRGTGQAKKQIHGLVTFTANEMKALEASMAKGLVSPNVLTAAKRRTQGFASDMMGLAREMRSAFDKGLISAEALRGLPSVPAAPPRTPLPAPILPPSLHDPMSPLIQSSELLKDRMGGVTGAMVRAVRASGTARTATIGLRQAMINFGKDLPGIDRQLGSLVKTLGFFAGVAAFGQMIRSGEQFNQKMRQSLAIMGDVSDMMRNDMAEAALEVARTTKFSAAESAEAFYFLASAGLTAQQSLAALPQVAKFAQAGYFDLAKATELATDAQAAIGLHVEDPIENLRNLTRVTDVLVKANTIADATTEQFAFAMTRKSAAAARIVGMEVEELVAVLAAYAQQGLKGVNAGTAFNIVLRDLTTKALQNSEAFRKLGVDVFDSNGELNEAAEIISDLEVALDGMSDAESKASLKMLGLQDKSMIFTQTLIGMSDKIKEFNEETDAAGGMAKEVADKQLTPFQKAMAKLGASTTELGQMLVNSFVPALANSTTFLSYFAKEFGPGIVQLTKFGVAVGAGVVAIKALKVALQVYTFMAQRAAAATAILKATTAGIGAIIDLTVGIGAAAAAIAVMHSEFKSIDKKIRESSQDMNAFTASVGKAVESKDGVDELSGSFKSLSENVELSLESLQKLVPAIENLSKGLPNFAHKAGVPDLISGMRNSIDPMMEVIKLAESIQTSNAITGDTTDALSGALDALESSLSETKNAADGARRMMVDMVTNPDSRTSAPSAPQRGNFLRDAISEAFEGLGAAISGDLAAGESPFGGSTPIDNLNVPLGQQSKEIGKIQRQLKELGVTAKESIKLPTVDLSLFEASIKAADNEIAKLQDAVGIAGPIGDTAQEGVKNLEAFKKQLQAAFEEGKRLEELAIGGKVPIEDAKFYAATLIEARKAINENNASTAVLSAKFKEILGDTMTWPEGLEKAEKILKDTKPPRREFAEFKEDLLKLAKAFPGVLDSFTVDKALSEAAEELDSALGGPKAKLEAMRKEYEQFKLGLTDTEIRIRGFEEIVGATESMKKAFAGLARSVEKIKLATSLKDSLKTPAENLEEKIESWRDLMRSDLITKEEFLKAIAKEREALDKDKKGRDSGERARFVGFADLGREFQQALFEPEDKTVTELKKHTDLLKVLADAERGVGGKDGVAKSPLGKDVEAPVEKLGADVEKRLADLWKDDATSGGSRARTTIDDLVGVVGVKRKEFEDRAAATKKRIEERARENMARSKEARKEQFAGKFVRDSERVTAAQKSRERIRRIQEEQVQRAEASRRRIKNLGREPNENVSAKTPSPPDPMTAKNLKEIQGQTALQKRMVATLEAIEQKPAAGTLT